MARLLIKFPTRNRPEKAKERLVAMRERLSGRHEVRFVITCDRNDPTMNNPDMRDWFRAFAGTADAAVRFGRARTKIQAVNANLRGEHCDVVLLASDDMSPQVDGFDAVIFDAFAARFPDYRGAVHFPDGLRDDDLMTYPVMGWELYRAFGYIYHPWYWSLYCDNELTESCQALGCFAREDTLLFRHEWTRGAWDALARRNENRWMYIRDGQVFRLRRRLGFGLHHVRRRLNK